MTDRKKLVRKGVSWLLSAALTIGLLSATGLTAGAETILQKTVSQENAPAVEEESSQEKAPAKEDKLSPEETAPGATASDAGKTEENGQESRPAAEEEPLDEDGVLLDGEVVGIPDFDPEETGAATRSNALLAQPERKNYPLLYPYFETSTAERLTFRRVRRIRMCVL